ncbi:MAG: SMI1/KNR4 family protein [Oscillospiraceae bacterium]|nr:SMI1/KNR4 family protein [Oscillospiraceae bacterium]MCD8116533.1 SMI1/KNR4 family protein [Oscillospiraceae bacterium]
MTLQEFIRENDTDCARSPIAPQDIPLMETLLGAAIGPQLREYLTTYGYLGYKFAELYGITATGGPNSDMIKKTQQLHDRYPVTKALIAIEDQGDGDYYLADGQDGIYRFLSATGQLAKQDMKLFDYILARFESIRDL